MRIDRKKNAERAERAWEALEVYIDNNDVETGATDLICDLLHLVNSVRPRKARLRTIEDAELVLRRGLRHFEAEAITGEV